MCLININESQLLSSSLTYIIVFKTLIVFSRINSKSIMLNGSISCQHLNCCIKFDMKNENINVPNEHMAMLYIGDILLYI